MALRNGIGAAKPRRRERLNNASVRGVRRRNGWHFWRGGWLGLLGSCMKIAAKKVTFSGWENGWKRRKYQYLFYESFSPLYEGREAHHRRIGMRSKYHGNLVCGGERRGASLSGCRPAGYTKRRTSGRTSK